MNSSYLKYLCCPKCKSDLILNNNYLICNKCHNNYEIIEDAIIKIIPDTTSDLKLSIKKWDKLYKKKLIKKSYIEEKNNYLKNYYEDTYKQLTEFGKIDKNSIYLEIGCGQMFLGQELAPKCNLVIGIDICPSALKIAKKMFEKMNIKNYLLIQGDILNIPLKSDAIDLIYGGGVIEHFKNTQQAINELYRISKKGGISFNTVPYLNLGSLTYRQIWGNIPNFPVLRQLAELIHIKLLKEKHMIFGYELSFLEFTLKKIHKKAGFKEIYIDRFKVKISFDFINNKFLKKKCFWLVNNSRLFWPMIKVIAKK